MNDALVKDADKYGGMFVAKASFASTEAVSAAPTLIEAYRDAERKGYKEPVVFFVPKKGAVQIY